MLRDIREIRLIFSRQDLWSNASAFANNHGCVFLFTFRLYSQCNADVPSIRAFFPPIVDAGSSTSKKRGVLGKPMKDHLVNIGELRF